MGKIAKLFLSLLEMKITDIRQRGRIPIVVGGTHYYIQSLLVPYSLPAQEDAAKRDNDTDIPLLPPADADLAEKYPILYYYTLSLPSLDAIAPN